MSKLDHVAIFVKTLDEAITFYMEMFNCKNPKTYEVETPLSKFRYSILSVDGNYIELIEPRKGTLAKLMEDRGEGFIDHICFAVDSIKKFYHEMKDKGIILVGDEDRPLIDKNHVLSPSGVKYAYLPRKITFGTSIQVKECS